MTHPLQGTLENRDGAWVLTLVRDFGHPPETVWPWLTDPKSCAGGLPWFQTARSIPPGRAR